MKNVINKTVFIIVSTLCLFNQSFAMKSSSRAGQAYVGRWIRPNAKSSLRYFAISPDRSCKTTTYITPSYRKAFASQRELSFGQIGSNLYKKARWSLTSREDKKAELFNALEDNILTRNADQTLSSVVKLFKDENLLNEPEETIKNLTPLEFAIKKSRHTNPEYQEELAEAFIKNNAQELSKALYFALENYNQGAVKALVSAVNPLIQSDFFAYAKKKLASEKITLENIISSLREEKNEPAGSEISKTRLELMGKLYVRISALKKILEFKKRFKQLDDFESIFSEKEEASL